MPSTTVELDGGFSLSIQQATASLGASVIQLDPAEVSAGGVSSGHDGRRLRPGSRAMIYLLLTMCTI